MKLIKHEKNENGKYELEFQIETDLFELGLKNAFHKNAAQFNVPGFRKGKAPRNIIEKMYGEEIFFDDAINALLPTEYQAALVIAGVKAVGNPSFELVSASKADGAVIKAYVDIKPDVTLKKYKGLKATKNPIGPQDDVINNELTSMQDRNARMIEKDTKAKAENGDTATIDFEGFVDGVAFEGGKSEDYPLLLGSNQFVPGFEDQIIGHKVGEEFDVNVEFPKEYHSEDLAGKPATFKVKLKELKTKELPVLDDEFAKDVSEFDTLDELKADMMKEAVEQAERMAELEVENALVEQIVEGMEADIPEVMFENKMDDMVSDFAYRLSQQGLQLELYLQYSGMDEAAFRETFREQAIQQVKIRMALEEIVALEKIDVTNDELQEELKKIAERIGVEEKELTESIPLNEIRNDIAVNKAIDLIREEAVVKEAAPEKKTAAKKATAKKETKDKKDEKKPAKKATPKKDAAKKDEDKK